MTAVPVTAPQGAIPPAGPDRLPMLAAGINDHLRAAEAATRHGLEHAIAIGQLLIEAKELVDHHGDWLSPGSRRGAPGANLHAAVAQPPQARDRARQQERRDGDE